MKVQLKILDKRFYSQEANGMLLNSLPSYATPGSAGMDLVTTEDVTLHPGETAMIHTGIAIWLGGTSKDLVIQRFSKEDDGVGYITDWEHLPIAGFVFPRSGLGSKGLVLANTVGVIDQDYQGELKISAWNRLDTPFKKVNTFYSLNNDEVEIENNNTTGINTIHLKAGARVAQLVILPVIQATWDIVEEFTDETQRGSGGWGHTG